MPDTKSAKMIKPPTTEGHKILRYLKNKSPEMILESIKSNKIKLQDADNGTLLDENNIL